MKIGHPLPPEFYLQNTLEVARQILGKGLYVNNRTGEFLVEITEVEVYLGGVDPASHAYRGLSARNWPMFERGGTCYIYLSYGINYCMNVATQPKGSAEALLLRAAAPITGLDAMRGNRGKMPDGNLLSGPGKLTQALGIDLEYNGMTFDRKDFKLVDLGRTLLVDAIGASPRIGISKAKEEELRFFIKGSSWLSRREGALKG